MGLLTRSVTASPFVLRQANAATNLGRAVLPVGFGVWLGFVIVVGRPNLEPDVYGATVRLHVLFGALFVAYCCYLALARKLPGPTPFDWPAAALIGAYALAVAKSVDPRLSAEASLQVLVCVAAFYVLAERRFVSLHTLVRSFVAIGLGVSLLTLLDVYGEYRQWLAAVEAIKGSVGPGDLTPPTLLRTRAVLDHPNILAMFLNMVLPFALALTIGKRGRFDRSLGAATAALGLAALFLTLSRGAWLGWLLAMPIFCCLVYLRSRSCSPWDLTRNWLRRHSRLVAFGLCLAMAAIGVALLLLIELRPGWLFRDTAGDRYETASAAARIFLDHPWTGAGPQTFGLLIEAYHGDAPPQLAVAHNAYLQTLADLGLAGAVVALAGAFVLLRALREAWRATGKEERLLLAACLSAVLAVGVHGLVESPASWNSTLLPFALVLALIVRLGPEAPRPAPGLSSIPRLAVLGLVPIILAGWLFFDTAHSRYDRSIRSPTASGEPDAAAAAIDAAESDRNAFAYQLHAGVSLVNFSQDVDATAVPGDSLARGIAYLRRAIELDPHSSLAHANLALGLQASKDAVGAIESARRALAASPEDPTIAVIAGTVLEWAGLHGEAIQAYGAAVSNDPSLAQSPFWGETGARLEMREEVIVASEAGECELGRMAALYGVYKDGLAALATNCEAALESGDAEARLSDLALILFAQEKVELARGEARRALRDLGSTPANLVLSAVVLSDGDLSAARYDLLLAAYLGDADARALLGFTYTDGSRLTAELDVPLLREAGLMPGAVSSFLGRVVSRDARSVDEAGLAYRAGRLHYILNLLRQAPEEVLVRGDWARLVSPRILAALEAFNQP